MSGRNTLFVFLCRTPKTTISPHKLRHFILRLWGWIVRPCHRSPAEHICIGHDGLVVDPLYGGNYLWQMHGFVRRYPIHSVITVTPTPYKISLRAFDVEKTPKNRWKPVLYWLTGLKRFQTDDCLGVALQCLHAAGIVPPRRFRTIGGMIRWLKDQGFKHERLAQAGGRDPSALDRFD